jgi:DNA-binding transcriptional LysR family regulator
MSTRASNLDLRMVQQFLAVAETLSFRKAAEQMHMAQPPLSQAIMRLESLVQARLFERSPRGVRLTPAGEVFKMEAARLLNQANRALERTQQAGRGELGTVHVGFIGPAMTMLLPKVILSFRERFAGVELTLHEGSSMQVAAMINSDTVDIGFLVTPAELEADVVTEDIVVDALRAVLPAGHRLGGAAQIHLEELADDAFVLFSAQGVPTLSSRIAQLCRQAGFEPRIVQEAVQISTVLGLVAGGLGVSILPGSISALATGGVVCKPIIADADLLRVRISAAYRRDKLSDAAQAFLMTARLHADTAPGPRP